MPDLNGRDLAAQLQALRPDMIRRPRSSPGVSAHLADRNVAP
jgi:hypothetical protein